MFKDHKAMELSRIGNTLTKGSDNNMTGMFLKQLREFLTKKPWAIFKQDTIILLDSQNTILIPDVWLTGISRSESADLINCILSKWYCGNWNFIITSSSVSVSQARGRKKHMKRLFSQSVAYSGTHLKFERGLQISGFDGSGWKANLTLVLSSPVHYKLPKTGRSCGRNGFFSWESVPQEI